MSGSSGQLTLREGGGVLGVGCGICYASQLPGKGPTDVDDAPAC